MPMPARALELDGEQTGQETDLLIGMTALPRAGIATVLILHRRQHA